MIHFLMKQQHQDFEKEHNLKVYDRNVNRYVCFQYFAATPLIEMQ